MILDKINKKVNQKKNIYLYSWLLEVDKIVRQNLGAQGVEKLGKRREKGRIRESLGEWDG